MSNIKKIQGIDCVGQAYIGQNYYVKFADEDDDCIDCTVEAISWTNVVHILKARHPDSEILEIEAC